MKIAVIGAGGRVGLPFCLVCAKQNMEVLGIDLDLERVNTLNAGKMPFREKGGQQLLNNHIGKNLNFTTGLNRLHQADVIVVIIGTPVDGEGNPRVDDLFAVAHQLGSVISAEKPTTIILRSTVSPGTTRVFKKHLDDIVALRNDSPEYSLYYVPERVAQGYGIEETMEFPWIIGTEKEGQEFGDLSEPMYYFLMDMEVKWTTYVTWEEAEIGKLMTNMYRYMNFAFANEMYIIGQKWGIDTHKMIDAFNDKYPRLNVPTPGPNVGGPCLFKDGKFLTAGFQFPELISAAFHINESMPEFVLDEMLKLKPDLSNILVLGSTFKAQSDDTRNSLSYKMVKCLKRRGIDYIVIDPFVGDELEEVLEFFQIDKKIDGAVLMTPHQIFYDYMYNKLIMDDRNHRDGRVFTDDFVYADVWKSSRMSRDSKSGILLRERKNG